MPHTLYQRHLSAPKSSFFLFGARGVGKSTWLHQTGIPFLEIDLLEEDLYQRYLARPELFRSELNTLKPGSWVFVDEIQRVPGLLNEVHRGIEKLRLKFILSGSSARRIVRGGANLLAGRALLRNLFPLTSAEMGKDFRLDEALEWGTLPVILASPERERKERLKAWVQTYLREEIQAEALGGTRLRPESLKGLEAIAQLPRLKRRILVYLGDRNMRTDSGIDVLTFDAFGRELAGNRLFC